MSFRRVSVGLTLLVVGLALAWPSLTALAQQINGNPIKGQGPAGAGGSIPVNPFLPGSGLPGGQITGQEFVIGPGLNPVDAAKKEEEARQKLPFKSIAERLPKGKGIVPSQPLSAEEAARWKSLDQNIARQSATRAALLKQLHEKTRAFFVAAPGFGGGRMPAIRPNDELIYERFDTASPSQPGKEATFPTSKDQTVEVVKANAEQYQTHFASLLNFVSPLSFGYVKDREHVAGFQSHRFQELKAQPKSTLSVDHILLVGILVHESPVVYLTEELPNMEDTRKAKTRKLDLFEDAGLTALKKGEDLYVVEHDHTLRMLGALRATEQCLQCHDTQRDALLGAFSYTLRAKEQE